MKFRSFALHTCATAAVAAALLLTACGGLGGSYYPYYPSYPPPDPSHSSGSAPSDAPGGNTGGSSGPSSTAPASYEPESPSSNTPANSEPASSSEPSAPSAPALPPEQQLALSRQEVFRLLNEERAKAEAERLAEIEKAQSNATASRKKELSYNEILPLSMENTALLSAAQERVVELSQMEKLSHKRPNGSSYITILAEHNISAKSRKEIYAVGPTTPTEALAYWKVSSDGTEWQTLLDAKYTQIGIGYFVREDGTPYWELLLIG